MRRAPRGRLLLALAMTVVCGMPQAGRGAERSNALDYATVGRVVARHVDGRTVVVIPVAGTVRPKLSEPIRAGKRWRLDLMIEDAKLASGGPVRRPEGLASLTVEEVGSDVRVSVEVNALGDYGARRSEEGMLLWIDAERKEPVAAAPAGTPMSIPITGAAVQSMPESRAQEAPVAPEGTNWVGLIVLAVGAAGAGAAVRHVRRNGLPPWAADLRSNAGPRLLELVGRGRAANVADEPDEAPRVPFGKTPGDPRGRSAEIGDAFRVQPERPASGIAALVATNENDAE